MTPVENTGNTFQEGNLYFKVFLGALSWSIEQTGM